MDSRLENLQLFCSNLDLDIDEGRAVQGGVQYTVKNDLRVVFVTLYDNGSCFARGANSDLLSLLKVWCDNSYAEGALHPDFVASWREWNTNAQLVKEYHTQNGGIPDELVATDDYKINREILFHDFMFASQRRESISIKAIEFVVSNWLKRFCFMNISPNLVMEYVFAFLQDYDLPSGIDDFISFGIAAEALSIAFVGCCHSKYFSCRGGCPFRPDGKYDCIKELVDVMYIYSEHPKLLSYNKTNLQKVLFGKDDELSWIDIHPTSPIEEKMKQALFEAGLLNVPQYQAFAPTRRYRVDYMVPTPNGGMLAIECDGLQYHATSTAYISDRRRDNLLLQQGITPVRFSSVDIETDIEGCVNTIESLFKKYQTGRQVCHRKNNFGYFNATE